jgi:hypothetical protein
MRIETNQKIAGYPARKVRQLMRETLGRPITDRWVSETLGCCEQLAGAVLAELLREGWVCRVGDHLEPSLQGSALAEATAAKPLTRSTAHKLISDVVWRAQVVNRQKKYAYVVQELVVFGSFLKGEARLNDVDVGVRLVPRWAGETQRAAEHRRRDAYSGDFRNISQWGNLAKARSDPVPEVKVPRSLDSENE